MLMMHQKTPSARQQQIKWTKIQMQEREIPPAVDHCAIIDCSTPPPNTHNLSNFGWAYFGCYSDPLSPATSPTLLMLVLRGRPDFIWLLSITSIISPSISMLMMMWWEKNMPCLRDARERSIRCAEPCRSSILGVGSWRPFWFDHIFHSMIFGQVVAKIRHGGGSRMVAFWPFTEVVRCCFFFRWWVFAQEKKLVIF